MKILAYRKDQDQFWIACSKEEAEKWFIPRLDSESLDSFKNIKEETDHWNEEEITRCLDMMKLLGVEDLDYAYFSISRDLSECIPGYPYFPVSPWWTTGSPFVDMDLALIQSPEELVNFVPTFDGKAISRD